jgi:hypothetical protein
MNRSMCKRRHGAALVETVLLMIVLLPLLLYAFFLMDAAYLKLDLQESVVSSLWDIALLNNPEHKESSTRAWETSARASRFSFSDHTSAFDDGAEVDSPGFGEFDRIRGRHNHPKHHKIYFAAQYTYRFDSASSDTEFQCNLEKGTRRTDDDPLLSSFSQKYSIGGEVRCEATGFIYNYLLPEKLFTQFTQVSLSNLTTRGKDLDSHDIQGKGRNIVATEGGALLFDTWALETGAPRQMNQTERISQADLGAREGSGSYANLEDSVFHKRVTYLSSTSARASFGNVTAKTLQFQRLANSNLKMNVIPGFTREEASITEAAGLPALDGIFLTARYKPRSPGLTKAPAGGLLSSRSGFESTPYKHTNPKYETAYNKRGLYYMGCKTEQQDGACP